MGPKKYNSKVMSLEKITNEEKNIFKYICNYMSCDYCQERLQSIFLKERNKNPIKEKLINPRVLPNTLILL